jgi:polar amino acid transport system substrate-binding protein
MTIFATLIPGIGFARRLARIAALVAAAVWACMAPLHAADPALPNLWDQREQIARQDLSKLPRLRFLTTTDFPPFNYLDASGRLAGFHVELARAICAELAIADRCQIQALPWAELQPALARGDGEAILAGIGISAESRAALAFSRPYMRLPARFVVAKSRPLEEPLATAVAEKRVGVLVGTVHEQILRDYFPAARVVTYGRADWMLDDLKAAKVDAVFGDGMRLSLWLARHDSGACCRFAGGPYMAPDYLGAGLAVALRPSDTMLVDAIDAALQQMSAKGVMAELYLKTFPVSFY